MASSLALPGREAYDLPVLAEFSSNETGGSDSELETDCSHLDNAGSDTAVVRFGRSANVVPGARRPVSDRRRSQFVPVQEERPEHEGGLMRLSRQFEHHFPTLRQQPLCVVIVASLWLVGCGSTPNFEDVATSQTGAAGANTLSIPVPPAGSGTGGAELLVAVLGIQANPNTTGPEGWTGVPGFLGFNDATCQSDGQGTACQLAVYYRIADGSETTAEFSWGGTRRAAGAVLRFSNVDADSPIGVAAPQRGSSDIPTAPVITTTRDGSIALRIAASELDEAGSFLTGSTALTDPPPTERLNMVSFPDAASDPANGCGPPLSGCDAISRAVGLAVSDTRHASAGGSGPVAWELGGGDQWITASIEIMRAPGE